MFSNVVCYGLGLGASDKNCNNNVLGILCLPLQAHLPPSPVARRADLCE